MMETIKAFYGIWGAPYPLLSLIMFSTFGAMIFGGAWVSVGEMYQKDQSKFVEKREEERAGIKIRNSRNISIKNSIFYGDGNAIDVGSSDNVNIGNIKKYGARFPLGQLPQPTGEFRNLSNSDLKKYVKEFSSILHNQESVWEKKLNDIRQKKGLDKYNHTDAELKNTYDEKEKDFEASFFQHVQSLASEIVYRTGVIKIPQDSNDDKLTVGSEILSTQMLVGLNPMSSVGHLLEFMASKL